MECNFKSRPIGRSYSAMLQLKTNLENGIDCAVATLNPEKFIRDFEYMTGAKLKLEPQGVDKDLYVASIYQITN